MPTFTPPTTRQPVDSGHRLLSRYHLNVGQSVVKRNGVYQQVMFPWAGELNGLTEGTDYFLGGRTYVVTSAVATALNAAGFTTVADSGYGTAPFGSSGYGA